MGRARSPFHVIAFLLTIVLGWPWNVAFAAAESSSVSLPTNHASWIARRGHRGGLVGRRVKDCQTSCPAVSPDFEEDDSGDGDDSGTGRPWSLATFPPVHPGMVVPLKRGTSRPTPRPTLRLPDLCRLRC